MLNMLQSPVVTVRVGVASLNAWGVIWMSTSKRDTPGLNTAYLFNPRNDNRRSTPSHHDQANTPDEAATLRASQGETGVAREQISVSDGDRSSGSPEGPPGRYNRAHFLPFVLKTICLIYQRSFRLLSRLQHQCILPPLNKPFLHCHHIVFHAQTEQHFRSVVLGRSE